MLISNFIYKFNWRLIIIHFVATFFFALAARQFAVLNNIKYVKYIYKYGEENAIRYLLNEGNFPEQFVEFITWINLSAIIGLTVGFLISLIITIRKKVFWANSLFVFIISIVLNKLGFFNNKIVDTLFFAVGEYAIPFGIQYKFIVNGAVLAFIGLFILFSKWTRNLPFVRSVQPDVSV